MSELQQLVECVPNISEGRNAAALRRVVAAVASAGVTVLHVDTGVTANRTVVTFAGELRVVCDAVRALFAECDRTIDLRTHSGVHPYVGAVDVCPFIALRGISNESLQTAISQLASELAQRYELPIYLYELSAQDKRRRALPAVRRGGRVGLAERLGQPEWMPDFGPARLHPRLGASILGQRELLIAFNVNLSGGTALQAQAIAARVRRRSPWVRAIAWEMPEYRCYQVSMNLLRFWKCGLFEAYSFCEEEAAAEGLTVAGSELIGLVPLQALEAVHSALGAYPRLGAGELDTASCIKEVVAFLGLDSVRPFDPASQILEHRLGCAALPFPSQEPS